MPRVAVYQGGAVQRAGPTDARFRAADYGPGPGAGIEQVGREIAHYAERKDEIESIYDEHDANRLDLEHVERLRLMQQSLREARGADARGRVAELSTELQDFNRELFSQARSPRARMILENSVQRRTQAELEQFDSYADTQFVEGYRATSEARISALTDRAVADPGAETELRGEIARLAQFEGWEGGASGEVAKLRMQDATDKIHDARIDRMFAVPDPQVDAIAAYLVENGDNMSPKLYNDVLTRLQKPLQGRMDRADADAVMGLAVAPVAAPAAGNDNLDAITAQAESGGREYDSAGRRITSPVGARGLMQVMPATARDPGFGIKPSDGSPEEDARVGREYRAKMEDRYGGDLAKMWGAYNWGPGNVDKAIAEHGEDWLRFAPRETQEYVAKNIAAAGRQVGSSYANAPREWDRAAIEDALSRRAAEEGWSPERVERVREELDRRVNRDEGLLREQRADADEKATQVVQSLGDGFKSTNQIPRDVWNRLSPSDKIAWEKVAEANSKPVDPPANGPAVMALNMMRFYEPDKFKTINLTQYVGDMTRAELDTMASTQAQMRTNEGKWTPRSGIVTALNYGKKINSLDLDDADEAAILQIMEAEAWQMHQANGGKPLTETDYETLFRSATRDVRTNKRFLGIATGQGSKPRYELDLGTMPGATRERLIKRLQDAGLPVNEENLLRLYRIEQ